jgi:hypothetical protein
MLHSLRVSVLAQRTCLNFGGVGAHAMTAKAYTKSEKCMLGPAVIAERLQAVLR